MICNSNDTITDIHISDYGHERNIDRKTTTDDFCHPQTLSLADASAVDSTKRIAREVVVEITQVRCTLMKII